MATILLLAGCGQSLFDSHGSVDSGPGGDDSAVPSSCPSPCLADAAGDYDGSTRGSTGVWRYLDDMRARAWTPMAGDATAMMGVGMNKITTCAKHGDAAACSDLPGALLITSSGATTLADPAIELTNDTNQNMQLTLRVRVPAGAPDQIVRLYRNSREDTLITATATSSATLDRLVKLDGLAGDRFLLSIAPMAMGAADVAVQLFANPTGAVFPTECQVAYSFETPTTMATTVADLCHTNKLTSWDYNTTPPDPVVTAAGPFPELGKGIKLVTDKYYQADTALDRAGDSTTQLWVKIDVMPPSTNGAWVYSDQDLDFGGGVGMVIFEPTSPTMNTSTCTTPSPPGPLAFAEAAAPYGTPTAWHFIRVVQKGTLVTTCVDGVKKTMYNLPVGKMTSTYAPRLGRNVVWTPAGAYTDGKIDDVRVINTALPCE